MGVDVKPLIDNTPLDVTIPNAGQEMEVDVDTNVKPIISNEEMRKMFDDIKMKVDVSERPAFKDLDLEDFGQQEGLGLRDF